MKSKKKKIVIVKKVENQVIAKKHQLSKYINSYLFNFLYSIPLYF